MKKQISLFLMAFLYFATGVNHFIMPSFYAAIVPYYLPFPTELVYISGVLQIAFALLLFPSFTRRIACGLIILLLVLFMPVHIQMLIDNSQTLGISFWVALIRIPLQLVFIYWAAVIAQKHTYKLFEMYHTKKSLNIS